MYSGASKYGGTVRTDGTTRLCAEHVENAARGSIRSSRSRTADTSAARRADRSPAARSSSTAEAIDGRPYRIPTATRIVIVVGAEPRGEAGGLSLRDHRERRSFRGPHLLVETRRPARDAAAARRGTGSATIARAEGPRRGGRAEIREGTGARPLALARPVCRAASSRMPVRDCVAMSPQATSPPSKTQACRQSPDVRTKR